MATVQYDSLSLSSLVFFYGRPRSTPFSFSQDKWQDASVKNVNTFISFNLTKSNILIQRPKTEDWTADDLFVSVVMSYAVVEFEQTGNDCGGIWVVCQAWLTLLKKESFWPPYKDRYRVTG